EPLESCDTMVSVSLTLFDGIAGIEDYVAKEDIQTYQTIVAGQTINYTAGREIVFKDGFIAEYGSEISAQITPLDCVVSCPEINVEQWINHCHIGGTITYHVLNANYYEYTIYSQIGQLVYHSEGAITSDIVDVWNNINYTGTFFYTIVFISNCGDTVSKTGILSLSSSKNPPTNTAESNIVQEINASDDMLQIYPNPATNNINIMVDSPLPYSMKMYDTKGNIFLQWDYLTVEKLVVNTNNLNSGVYYLGVQSGAKFVTKKIVIQ
ncbi:MAG: T9SS type A sorting domain-containing protein, partial [Bacteroidales bacterium]|nr:T9SS type A sorting domain-containing protein [Bacteroidales bacterium]